VLTTLLIDFHTHSSASDGDLAPRVLLERAIAAGVTAMAITDHDSIAGYQAVQSSTGSSIQLISGVEMSCVWGATTIHVVGLGFDPQSPVMDSALDALHNARRERSVTIAERLASRQVVGALEGARAVAGESQIGRPHFARWMVSEGYVPDMNTAFKKYLGQGKLGDVKTFWPSLNEVVGAISDAGGLAILAHPLKYSFTRMKLGGLCNAFKDAGGGALEVLNGRQTPADTSQLKQLASHWGLQISAGSDFHREWQYGADLGVDTAIAGTMPAVWEHLL